MKNILIPTDFSACAQEATEAGFEIAQKTGAEVHLLHSLNPELDWAALESFTKRGTAAFSGYVQENLYPDVEKTSDEVRDTLTKLVEKGKSMDISVTSHLETNFTPYDIIKFAKNEGIDLIVLGTHGKKGLDEKYIGSVTQKVVRNAHCPVLTVRENKGIEKLKNIVFASSFTEEQGLTGMEHLKTFAGAFDAQIHFLHVVTPNDFHSSQEVEEKMKKFISNAEIDAKVHSQNDYSVEEGVLSFFERNEEMDLLSIATHGFSGIRRLVSGTITESLINHFDHPVLSWNINKS